MAEASPAVNGESPDQHVFVDDDGNMWGEDELGRYRIDNRVWTWNEIQEHPLFMKDIPSDPRDIDNYPMLTALQSILYDDQTPEEVAEHFKKQGNEAMKLQASKIALMNALTFYTKGLEMSCKDAKLNSVLHSNRAAVGLKMGEYLKVVDDCRHAVRLDGSNLKAWFRGAQASEVLGLAEQGLKFCHGALKLDPKEPEVLRVQKQLQARLEKDLLAQQEMRQLDKKLKDSRKANASAVESFLQLRGCRLGPVLFDMSMYRMANGGLTPHPKLVGEDPEMTVEWPMLLLYDEANQSDFVAAFDERYALEDQLQMMFPEDRHVEWDEQGKYVWKRLAAYLEFYPEGSDTTSMFRVDNAAPMVEVLRDLCLPPCLVLHVLVDGSPAQTVFCKENSL
ncbi:unnamed protein product [Cladocopium goreaui]|uniref:DEAD-box ATP-dependent RNA helicase 56 n=1 Tax=Cladocopium goreaui TaxID=2562237 RepID=A0A9P1FSF0_9DINO|nr:unnamed protein product [Cladocopium goreaui]